MLNILNTYCRITNFKYSEISWTKIRRNSLRFYISHKSMKCKLKLLMVDINLAAIEARSTIYFLT